MPVEIVMPRMGLTMEEGTVVAWLKTEGQAVAAGEPLLEIETDKTTVEIEAPQSGTMGRILAAAGETVPVGGVIAYLLASAEVSAFQAEAAAEPAAPRVRASPAARRLASRLDVDLRQVGGTGPGGRVVAWNVQAAAASMPAAQLPAARTSPVAQRVAQALGVDLSQTHGTGAGGRITRQDVERQAMAARGPKPADGGTGPQEARAAQPPQAEAGGGHLQPLSRREYLVAERMAASFAGAPHFYLHAEVDARQLAAVRTALLPKLEARAGVHLTYTDLLVKLCALALVQHPRVMAQWAEGGLRQPEGVHIGIAMDTPQGLIVPVIQDADRLGLSEIARRRTDLAGRAPLGKLLPQELERGTFTLTNLGMFRVDAFDAILNPPQAAILAVGRIHERALVDNGAVIAAPTMMLSLSVDHRVLDGAAGARFLGDLAELIETPALALG